MSIDAVCPECQNRFQLQAGMVGKSMRCPVCQEVFVVREAAPSGPPKGPAEPPPATDTPPRTRTDAPPVVSRSGSVGDFVPVIKDVAPAAPPRPAPPPPGPRVVTTPPPPRPGAGRPPGPVNPPTAADFPWEDGPKAKPPRPAAPKEVSWNPAVAPPGKREAPPVPLRPRAEEDEPIDLAPAEAEPTDAAPRRPKNKKRFRLLVGMVAFVIVGLGAGGFFLVRYINYAPQRLMEAAEKEYHANNFDQARRIYARVVAEHPTHELAPQARFFMELSGLRHTGRSVTIQDDPAAAVSQWDKFLNTIQDPALAPFADRGRFGIDIWETGVKLAEDVTAKATRTFNEDNPDESEKWLTQAAAIDKALDRFRPDDATRPEGLVRDMAALRKRVGDARATLAELAKASEILGDGADDARVRQAREFAQSHGLDRDPRFVRKLDELINAREQDLQAKAGYFREPQPIPPTTVPDDGLTSLLFAPRFDRGDRRALPGLTTVFFCLARGVLYALDEADGHVLWAARTGLDTDIMPVRVPASDQNPEMVLVASNTGNQFGITARSGRSGAPLWHHALSVPCQGPPAVVGPNAYVSLADRDGTILEVSLGSGDITGRMVLGRPLGPTLVARPGTGHLYAIADARAVYVFDVDRHGPEPEFKRLDPALLGVMTTNHPAGSLRGVPVFSNPDPGEPGPKFFVLGQAAGLETMLLRAFRLPDAPDGKPDPSPTAKEIPLPGWASFPPYCDGEKVAVVTDQGEFGLYGLALAGNKDEDLFSFPSRPPKPGELRPSRGQVVRAEEGSFWILAGGELRRLRFGISPGEGVRLVQYGDPIPAGEPLHGPQVNARGDTFVIVTQDGMICRATAVDARTGLVRWRRELGLIAKGDPLRLGGAVVLLDQGGGIYRVDTKPLGEGEGAAWLVDDRWLIAQPARGYTALTGLMAGPNGTAVAVLGGEPEGTPMFVVRKFNGAVIEDRKFPAPAPLAGQPVVSGTMLILPMANGTLYRLPLAEPGAALEEGPSWRADRLSGSAVCYLAPMNADTVFATDGARSVVRWRWPASSKLFEMEGRITLTERPAASPVVVPGSPPRLVLADGRGNLSMWDADRLAPPALKAWRPGGRNSLPAGPVSDGLRLEADPAGGARIVYSVAGRLVWLAPDADNPKWVGPDPVKAVEGRAVIDGGRILLTDRAGIVRVIDTLTGKETGEEFRLNGSHAFASAAVPVGHRDIPVPIADGVSVSIFPVRIHQVLVPLADGTVVLGDLRRRPTEAPKPKETAAPEPPVPKKSPAAAKAE